MNPEHQSESIKAQNIGGSLAFRLLRAVFAIYLLITFAIGAYEVFSEYQSEKKRIETSLQVSERIFGQAIAAALWGFDEEQISATLKGIVKLPDIVGIWLVDADGTTQYQEGVVDRSQATNGQDEQGIKSTSPTDLFFHSFRVRYETYDIGEVHIYSSESIILEKVKDRLISVGILFLVQAIVLWSLIYWAFNRYLMRTLDQFVGELEAIDFDSLEEGSLQLDTFGAHELKRMEIVFNAMKQRILKSRSALESLNSELESKVIQRTKQIARQQDVLEAMARQGRIGAWEFDVENERLFWTAMTKEIHDLPIDYEPDLDQAIKFYKEGESRAVILQAMENAIQRGLPWNVELQLVTAKGREIWVAATGQAQMEGDRCVRLFGSFQDIDTRMKVQKELELAKDNAESADRAKSQFLASMSHEIRTPLNGMLGILHLLRRAELTKDQQHQINLAMSSADTLLRVINDILDISKIEAGKLEIEKSEFDLHELLSDVVEVASINTQEKGLELYLDIAEVSHSHVLGDENRVRQIFLNLINNSAKFTHDGWIKVSASMSPAENGQLELKCTVEDTGIGISASRQKAIFGLFTQVDSSTTRKYGGTGLGLAIVRQLCQLMGGGIEVESELGHGSQFHFNILLSPGDSRERRVEPDLDQEHYLVLSDKEVFRLTLAKQLRQWGALVESTDDVSRLDISSAMPVNFVFVDQHWLERESNKSIVSQMRESEHFTAAHFVMVGSAAQSNSQVLQHVDRFVSKPLTPHALIQVLDLPDGDHSEAPESSPIPSEPIASPQGEQNARILLVEDNEVNQWVAQAMLQQYGLQADLAVNGREAVEQLKAEQHSPYAVILMDCQMPEMDGYEATQHIRAGDCGETYRSIPIIAMTANAMKGDREKCLESGMSDYLAKPIDPDRFESVLKQWLKL